MLVCREVPYAQRQREREDEDRDEDLQAQKVRNSGLAAKTERPRRDAPRWCRTGALHASGKAYAQGARRFMKVALRGRGASEDIGEVMTFRRAGDEGDGPTERTDGRIFARAY